MWSPDHLYKILVATVTEVEWNLHVPALHPHASSSPLEQHTPTNRDRSRRLPLTLHNGKICTHCRWTTSLVTTAPICVMSPWSGTVPTMNRVKQRLQCLHWVPEALVQPSRRNLPVTTTQMCNTLKNLVYQTVLLTKTRIHKRPMQFGTLKNELKKLQAKLHLAWLHWHGLLCVASIPLKIQMQQSLSARSC